MRKYIYLTNIWTNLIFTLEILDFFLSTCYDKIMDIIYQFNDRFNFTIARCGNSLVGNKQLHPEVKHTWNMDTSHKFRDWDCDRLWVVKKGKGHIVTTFGDFDILEGHAYYIPASTILKTSCEDFMEQYFINFVTVSNNLPLNSLYSFRNESNRFTLALDLIDNIIQENKTPNTVSPIIINSAMTTLLSLFINEVKRSNISPLLPAIEYIDQHLHEKLSISYLAELVGYTPEYFSLLFKTIFHISPQQYITQKRISLAKHLLLSSTLPISDIAIQCGYNDPLHFSKVFSKQTFCSPSKFRTVREDT